MASSNPLSFASTANNPSSISKKNGYDANSYTYYPVIVVGAGETGIAMGCRLKEVLGFDQFRIFDRQEGIGGTWWINRYPGVACDVPAIFYSFSFSPNHKWTTFHPPGPEIVKYLQGVCEKYQITDKIQVNTDVSQARWLEDEELWEVTLTHMVPGAGDLSSADREQKIKEHGVASVHVKQEIVRAKILASAVGGLVEPRGWPENIPGRDTFEGDMFHSARWDYNVDLNGKDVVVVGTGCSAAQFVPKLTQKPFNAKSVTQLMRSPPWVVPRATPPFGKQKWEKYSPKVLSTVPGLASTLRALLFLGAEYDWRLFGGEEYHEKERKKLEKKLLEHMKKNVPERYHEILTPDYGVGCKRRIFDATWFPGLNDPKINLTTLPLTSVQPRGVTLGPGRSYPNPKNEESTVPKHEVQIDADAIILANGFDTTQWLHPLKVIGKGGVDLHQVWEERGGPQAYLGTAMDGFPNFFILFGPNTVTGHTSVILASENMVNYSLKLIRQILRGDVRTFDIKKEAEMSWTKDIQARLKKTVWFQGGCQSWYNSPSGWNSTVYPRSQFDFIFKCMFPKWSDWNIEYTEKGLLKQRSRQLLKYLAFVVAIVGVYQARQAGMTLFTIPEFLRQSFRSLLTALLNIGIRVLENLRSKV
ncbi:MAG: hypothetical protein M1827_006422 [Pycnora praestabilis]|nr:MAG: hypothetical protein M1827_006422 [Pycnora praestabilis]